ncbi:hypothetical protein ACL7TT_19830 [Microbulbifer sp. 2304DJ12-6]|uniref:hypothetical protein n=1 Tax=Microbulbifer sp. 2304DJ12-6 TaxID=3233340 RepID=UPI0039AFD4F6
MKIFMFFSMMLSAQAAFGCYCVSSPLEERYLESDYVYLGQVRSSTLGDNGVVTNKLAVLEKIKGTADTQIVKNTLFPDDMCASHMVVGYKYVVFGKIDSTPEIHSCSNTRSLVDIGKEGLALLQEMANKRKQ